MRDLSLPQLAAELRARRQAAAQEMAQLFRMEARIDSLDLRYEDAAAKCAEAAALVPFDKALQEEYLEAQAHYEQEFIDFAKMKKVPNE